MTLEAKVKELIRREGLLSKGDRILAAVSGGPDSVALLHCLCDLQAELGLHLEVAHLEHGLRGEAARQDAEFVRGLACTLGFSFHRKEVALREIKSDAGRGNLEAFAREQRYRFFAAVAGEQNLAKVATGHTQDDQAETVLMWLLRGCGLKGLGGMAPIDELNHDGAKAPGIKLVRPLLGVSRNEVLDFLRRKGAPYRQDQTNQDDNLLRNWIRLRLIPELTERIDAKLPARLGRQAELLRAEQRLLENLATQELGKIASGKSIDRRLLLERDKAVQRLVLRRWIGDIRGHLRAIDFTHIEDLLRLVRQRAPQGRVSVPGGWEAVREYDILRLERRLPSPRPVHYSYELAADINLQIPEAGMTLHGERLSPPLTAWPRNLMEAVFDLAHLPENLTVRNFRHGDRYQPLGMTGHQKVKQLLIDKKVPFSRRSTLPLVSCGGEILWIPGYARSEIGKVSPETREILRLTAVSASFK